MKTAVPHRQFIVRQSEIAFQPFQEGWLKDSPAAIKRIAGEPDQFRPSKADVARVIQLGSEFFVRKSVYWAAGRAIEQSKLHFGFWIMLPDKLQHQQLVEISIEQGPCNR